MNEVSGRGVQTTYYKLQEARKKALGGDISLRTFCRCALLSPESCLLSGSADGGGGSSNETVSG